MLARRLPTILRAMTLADAIDTTRIHRVAGRTGARTAWVTTRPFRAPHHTIADAGRIGGGQMPTPAKCPSRTTACASWRHRPSVAAMCAKSCVSPWRRVSQPSHCLYRPDGTA
jgi:hypothetical protein